MTQKQNVGYRISKRRLSAGGWLYTLLKDSSSTGTPGIIQAGSGVPVDPESLDMTAQKPLSPYDYERLVA
jgi:hypothetical protein